MERNLDQTQRLLLESISILTKPEQQQDKKSDDVNQFDYLLQRKLCLLHEALMSATFSNLPCLVSLQKQSAECTESEDIRWQFISVCLHLLTVLVKTIEDANKKFKENMERNTPKQKTPHQAPPLSPDVLSVAQEKSVLTVLQFIVCLGICPNLDRGVGIPLEMRSGFKDLLQGGKFRDIPQEERCLRLCVCARVFAKCLSVPSLGALVLSRHLNDFLAALLQLSHSLQVCESKSLKSEGSVPVDTASHDPLVSSGEVFVPSTGHCESRVKQLVHQRSDLNSLVKSLSVQETDQEFAESCLSMIMSKVNPSLLVRDLVMLQGSKGNTKKGSQLPVSPPWLRRVCGRLMTDILMRSHGLLHVLQGMLPISGAKSADSGDWKKCRAIAMVIAHCPMQTSSVEEYYKHICSQIQSLLHHRDPKVVRHYLRVILSLIKELANQNEELIRRHLLDVLLRPLLLCVQQHDFIREDVVIASEADLTMCIEDTHRLYVSGTEAQSALTSSLSPCIQPLFRLFISCRTGVSHLRTPCEEILTTILKQVNSELAVELLWLLSVGVHGNRVKEISDIDSNITFQPGESGGMTAALSARTDENVSLDDLVSGIVCLVKHLKEGSIAGDFFITLLQELTKLISARKLRDDNCVPANSSDSAKELFLLEEQDRKEVELFNRKLIILNLLASLCEELGPSCLNKTQHVLAFVKSTLERGVEVCRATDDEVTGLFESETLTMAMGLLTAVMGGAVEVEEADRKSMEELLPLLDAIRQEHASDEVREMADDLRIAVATRGAVWSELMKTKMEMKNAAPKAKTVKTEKNRVHETKKPVKPLIEVMSESAVNSGGADCEKKAEHEDEKMRASQVEAAGVAEGNRAKISKPVKQREKSEAPMSSELEQAFKELCAPEIPVRGHGLLRLTNLVQKKDPSILSRHETLVKVFEENLQHVDSYLYLASINGLVALADVCPDIIVARLAREFADFDSGSRKTTPEIRMKLGESLVKTARNLGDMIPKYRDLLLAAILSGTRSADALVRASSLSNLAEVCKLLRFSLGSVIHEVFTCCSSIAKSDPEAEARRAAVMTITQLLQGMGSDSLKVLENILKDLYRLLKSCHSFDTDEMVRTHALLALNELDDIMRGQLFPQQKLQKKITVLHPD